MMLPAFWKRNCLRKYFCVRWKAAPEFWKYIFWMLSIAAKVQQEIDEVVGANRIPGMDDWVRMPFTNAVIHETQRFEKGSLEGFPRATMCRTEFRGYIIPQVWFTHGMISLLWGGKGRDLASHEGPWSAIVPGSVETSRSKFHPPTPFLWFFRMLCNYVRQTASAITVFLKRMSFLIWLWNQNK